MTNTTEETHHSSIQEASRLTGLPESTLRYDETIGVIDPIARDLSSGHRRYSERDIDAAISIACLSATGLSIEHMRTYLRNRTHGADAADDQIALLEQQQRVLSRDATLLRLRQQYLAVKVAYWQAVRAGDLVEVGRLTSHAHQIAGTLRSSRPIHNKEAA